MKTTNFNMAMNAAGAVGDIFIVGLLLRKPTSCLLRDFGTGITLYTSTLHSLEVDSESLALAHTKRQATS